MNRPPSPIEDVASPTPPEPRRPASSGRAAALIEAVVALVAFANAALIVSYVVQAAVLA